MNAAISVGPKWFHIAVQALVVLAGMSDGACPSSTMAQELKSHAVFVRRVLAQLVRAGLVEAHEGRDGGYLLTRSPERITLAEIYQAVKPAASDEADKSLNADIGVVLTEIGSEAERRALDVFDQYTIASVLERVAAKG